MEDWGPGHRERGTCEGTEMGVGVKGNESLAQRAGPTPPLLRAYRHTGPEPITRALYQALPIARPRAEVWAGGGFCSRVPGPPGRFLAGRILDNWPEQQVLYP